MCICLFNPAAAFQGSSYSNPLLKTKNLRLSKAQSFIQDHNYQAEETMFQVFLTQVPELLSPGYTLQKTINPIFLSHVTYVSIAFKNKKKLKIFIVITCWKTAQAEVPNQALPCSKLLSPVHITALFTPISAPDCLWPLKQLSNYCSINFTSLALRISFQEAPD